MEICSIVKSESDLNMWKGGVRVESVSERNSELRWENGGYGAMHGNSKQFECTCDDIIVEGINGTWADGHTCNSE